MFPLPAGGGRWETSFISSLRSQGFLLFSDPAPSRTTWRRNPLSQYCYFLCSSVCALPVKLYRFGRHRIDKVGAFQEYGASWFPLTRYEYLALAFQGLVADCVIGYDWVLKGLLGRCWKKGKVIENENDRYARMEKKGFFLRLANKGRLYFTLLAPWTPTDPALHAWGVLREEIGKEILKLWINS